MKSSKASPSSNPKPVKRTVPAGAGSAAFAIVIALLLAAISAAAIAFFYSRGCLLYYGDAAAHLNIARRIIDSRNPGYTQIGTVWLPLPHLLMVPFAGVDSLWMSGLAGAIPSGICFVIAGVFTFLAARRVFGDTAAAATACLLLAANPNLLYLQSVPMTESVFLACVAALLYFTVRFRETQSWGAVIGAGIAGLAATMTRYEGWFLIPFITLYFLVAARRNRFAFACAFGAIASIGPVYWLLHNLILYSNALEFYNGPSSAKEIYQRALDQGMARYPGDHDWRTAAKYFWAAVRVFTGKPLIYLGFAGVVIALWRRALWPLILLALVPAFYVWSMHSGGTPIFVPHLWPHGYYNSRYASGAVPLLAFAAAALVLLVPVRWRKFAAIAVLLAAVAPWMRRPGIENLICWKESQVNSEARRAWSRKAADYMLANYRRGEGVLTSFGDLATIFQLAGIPLREAYNECNGPEYQTLLDSPKPAIREKWAIAISGDRVARAISRCQRTGPRYDLVKIIAEKGAPVIEIYRRQS